MSDINITESTIALIDSLKSTTGAFGLAGTGSEYKNCHSKRSLQVL